MISNKNTNIIVPIILAGGTGTRLWPLSRRNFPKQFLNLLDEDEYTMLQKTYKRIENLDGICKPIIICSEEHRFIVGEQMKKISVDPSEIILEPEGRNTTPAITISALKALEQFSEKNIDPILLILSADHQIQDIGNFHLAIENSIEIGLRGDLAIFGVTPTYPATGYGYIKSEEKLNPNKYIASKVDCFVEKPDLSTASLLIKDKKYCWNSGMFLFKASSIINEIRNFNPDILKDCEKCLEKSTRDLDFLRLEKKSFINCENISIDIAVFEKTKKAFVMPLDCGWDDIGGWQSLWEVSKKDKVGNAVSGRVLIKDTKNSLIKSEEKLVVSIGLENIVIVETKDSVLVSSKNSSQSIKEMVSHMKEKGFDEAVIHKKVFRPWGSYLSIEEGETWQIKKIEVNPGASLSLQMHHKRSEHWVVVRGIAKVEIDSKKMTLSENESAYIPLGAKHRLSNPSDAPLILIEVQSGNYLGEDDIVRFEDLYGR